METTIKKESKQQRAINYFLSKDATVEIFHDLKIFQYPENNVAAFSGKGAKPYAHYHFKSIELVENWITEQKALELKNVESNDKHDAERLIEREKIQPGSILYASWGYEQTNIDFYKIVDRKGDFVTVQEIGGFKTRDERYDDRGNCTADLNSTIGEPFKKKVNKWGGITLNSYKSAYLWDGHPLYWSSYA